MLRFKLEIIPFGNEKHTETLVSVGIWNTVSTDPHPSHPKWSNYKAKVVYPGGRVRNINIRHHERSTGYWPLLRRLAKHLEKEMR